MSIGRSIRLTSLAVGLAVGAAQGVRAQGDPSDLAFWQSIQNSTNPAEYQAYLEAFPNGTFAALARLRARGGTQGAVPPGPGGAATQVTAPVPVPAPEPVVSPEKIIVTPPVGRVGQTMSFNCQDFPETGVSDYVVVVPAGTPDMDPRRNRDETKVLRSDYAPNCKNGQTLKGGPFAPGRYEARFMTMLYNNDKQYEVHARTPFSIR